MEVLLSFFINSENWLVYVGIIILLGALCIYFCVPKPVPNKSKHIDSEDDLSTHAIGLAAYMLKSSGKLKDVFDSFDEPLKDLSFSEEEFKVMLLNVWTMIGEDKKFLSIRREGKKYVPILSSFTQSTVLDMNNSIDIGFCNFIVIPYESRVYFS